MPVIDLRPYSEPHYMHYKYAMFMMPICIDAKVIVETGFQDGTSTNIFLESLKQLPGYRKLHTYEFSQPSDHSDTIKGRQKALMDTQNRLHSDIWCYHTQDSVQGAKEYQRHTIDSIDFLYLDSDHGLDHVYNELVEWSKCLSNKAIIMVDDAFDYDKQVPTGPMISSQKWMEQHPEWKMLVFPEKHGPLVMYR